jgi:16S rRNA (guanine527-N7)-methyltransferase
VNYFDSRTPIMLSLGVESTLIPTIKSYVERLQAANQELNLVSRKMTTEELIDNHVIDCLLALRKFRSFTSANEKTRIADFGSGGGLPGILFAILNPHFKFTLFEKSPRKQEFLANLKDLAPNVSIGGEIGPDLKEIDLVMARAFKPLDVILDMSRTYYKNSGRYILLKGRREKIDEEVMLAKKKFKDLKISIEKIESPVLNVERNIVTIGA